MIEDLPKFVPLSTSYSPAVSCTSTDFRCRESKYLWEIQVLERRLNTLQGEHHKLMAERSRRIEELTEKCNDLKLELVMSSPLTGLTLEEDQEECSQKPYFGERKRRRSINGVFSKCDLCENCCSCCQEKKLDRERECLYLKEDLQRLMRDKTLLLHVLEQHGHPLPSTLSNVDIPDSLHMSSDHSSSSNTCQSILTIPTAERHFKSSTSDEISEAPPSSREENLSSVDFLNAETPMVDRTNRIPSVGKTSCSTVLCTCKHLLDNQETVSQFVSSVVNGGFNNHSVTEKSSVPTINTTSLKSNSSPTIPPNGGHDGSNGAPNSTNKAINNSTLSRQASKDNDNDTNVLYRDTLLVIKKNDNSENPSLKRSHDDATGLEHPLKRLKIN